MVKIPNHRSLSLSTSQLRLDQIILQVHSHKGKQNSNLVTKIRNLVAYFKIVCTLSQISDSCNIRSNI